MFRVTPSSVEPSPNRIQFKNRPKDDTINTEKEKVNSVLPEPMMSVDLQNVTSDRPTTSNYKINPIQMIKDITEDERPTKRGLKLMGFPRKH